MSKKNPSTNQADELIFEDDSDQSENIQGKIKDLKDQLKSCQAEKGEYLAGWQRSQADYVNLKKETDKRQLDIITYANAGLLEDLIPLADSFELAMSNKEVWESVPANWRKGIEYIYNKLESIFSDHHLEIISSINVLFNPLEHESIGTIDTQVETEDHLVLEIIKKGYKLKERVVRPAQVKIGLYRQE